MAFRCLIQRCPIVLLLLLLSSVFCDSLVLGTLSSQNDAPVQGLDNDLIDKRASDFGVCASLENQVNTIFTAIEAASERKQKLEKSYPERHTELRKRAVLWKPKSKDRKSLLACIRGGRRSSAG